MSFVWSVEEADYLKAVLPWEDKIAGEDKRTLEAETERRKETAFELRILVVGAKCQRNRKDFYPYSGDSRLEQAPNNTEAAVLVYDVKDTSSFSLAEGLAELIRDSMGTQFVEVAAKTGENVKKVFVELGKDVLKIKRLNQQRRGQAQKVKNPPTTVTTKRRLGFWKTLGTPFIKRGVRSQ